jgi:hypothetical protein
MHINPVNSIKDIVLIVSLFALIFWVAKGIGGATVFECIKFSFATAIAPGYIASIINPGNLGYRLIPEYHALAMAETIVGTFLWAAFIATFTRKNPVGPRSRPIIPCPGGIQLPVLWQAGLRPIPLHSECTPGGALSGRRDGDRDRELHRKVQRPLACKCRRILLSGIAAAAVRPEESRYDPALIEAIAPEKSRPDMELKDSVSFESKTKIVISSLT